MFERNKNIRIKHTILPCSSWSNSSGTRSGAQKIGAAFADGRFLTVAPSQFYSTPACLSPFMFCVAPETFYCIFSWNY